MKQLSSLAIIALSIAFACVSCEPRTTQNDESSSFTLEIRSDKELSSISVLSPETAIENTYQSTRDGTVFFHVEFVQGRAVEELVFDLAFEDGSSMQLSQMHPGSGQKRKIELKGGKVVSDQFSVDYL